MPRPPGETMTGHDRCDVVSLDFQHYGESNDGSKWVLAAVDDYSGMTWLKAVDSPTADHVVTFLQSFIVDKPLPRFVITDGGSHFVAAGVEAFLAACKSKHHVTVAFRSQANGVVERSLRTLRDALSVVMLEAGLDTVHWPVLIPSVNRGLNLLGRARLGGHSPLHVWLGRAPEDRLDIVTAPPPGELARLMSTPVSPEQVLSRAQIVKQSLDELDTFLAGCKRRSAPAASARASHLNAEPGTYVLWAQPERRGSKISSRWNGPWMVTAKHSDHVYTITDLDGTNVKVVHAARLRRFAAAHVGRVPDMRLVASRDKDHHLDVGEIKDHRRVGEGYCFSLTWRIAPGEVSEVPGTNLLHAAPELVSRYVNAQRPPDVALAQWVRRQQQIIAAAPEARRAADADRADDMTRARSSRGQRTTIANGSRRGRPHRRRAPSRHSHRAAPPGAPNDQQASAPSVAHDQGDSIPRQAPAPVDGLDAGQHGSDGRSSRVPRRAAINARQQNQALRFGSAVTM